MYVQEFINDPDARRRRIQLRGFEHNYIKDAKKYLFVLVLFVTGYLLNRELCIDNKLRLLYNAYEDYFSVFLHIPKAFNEIVFESGIAHYLRVDELGVSELIEMSFLTLVVAFFLFNGISDYVTNQERKAAERAEEQRLLAKSQCERVSVQEYA